MTPIYKRGHKILRYKNDIFFMPTTDLIDGFVMQKSQLYEIEVLDLGSHNLHPLLV